MKRIGLTRGVSGFVKRRQVQPLLDGVFERRNEFFHIGRQCASAFDARPRSSVTIMLWTDGAVTSNTLGSRPRPADAGSVLCR
jgi:hypothetical protein